MNIQSYPDGQENSLSDTEFKNPSLANMQKKELEDELKYIGSLLSSGNIKEANVTLKLAIDRTESQLRQEAFSKMSQPE